MSGSTTRTRPAAAVLRALLAIVLALGLMPLPAYAAAGDGASDQVGLLAPAALMELSGYGWYTEAGGASGAAYTVSTGAELRELADIVNGAVPAAYGLAKDSFAGKVVTLAADIDLSAYADWEPIGGAIEMVEIPIGSQEELAAAIAEHGVLQDEEGNYYSGGPNEEYSSEHTYFYLTGATFEGTFDGGGHDISGLSITSGTGVGYRALFGRNAGIVKGFTVSGSVGTADGSLGDGDCWAGAVAYNTGTVTGVINRADIYPRENDTYAVGGVVGRNDGGTVSQCGNEGDIQSNTLISVYRVGGVVGHLLKGGTVTECYNTGDVEAWNFRNGMQGVSGIVGSLGEGNSGVYGGEVTWCYNMGTIRNGLGDPGTGGKQGTGGIVGSVDTGDVSHCYATGDTYAPGSCGIIIGKVGNGSYTSLYSKYEARAHQQYGSKIDEAGIRYADGSDENEDGSIKYGGAAIANSYNAGYTISGSRTVHEADMKGSAFAAELDAGQGKFNVDSENMNGGFPVLAWQGGTSASTTMWTVAFDSAGGSAVPSQTVEEGATAMQPADPARDGYEFAGWMLEGAPYDFSTPVTGDITLVATWTESAPVIGDDLLHGGEVIAAPVGGEQPEGTLPPGSYRLADDATGVIFVGSDLDFEVTGSSWDAEAGAFTGPMYRNLHFKVADNVMFTLQDVYIDLDEDTEPAIDFAGRGSLSVEGSNIIDRPDGYGSAATIHVGPDASVTFGGTGVLYGYKHAQGAFIGASAGEANGAITFAGGSWFLKGSKTGALIGSDSMSGVKGGAITVNAGELYLKVVAQGAAMGSSRLGNAAPDVVLNGGMVQILTDFSGSAIGSGGQHVGDAGTLSVNGGSLMTIVTPNAFSSWGYSGRPFSEGSLVTEANVTAAHEGMAPVRLDTSEWADEAAITVDVDGARFYEGAPAYAYVTNENKNPTDYEPATLCNWYPNDAAYLVPEGDPYTAPNSGPEVGKSKFAGESALYLWLPTGDRSLVVNGDTYLKATWDEGSGTFSVVPDELAQALAALAAAEERARAAEEAAQAAAAAAEQALQQAADAARVAAAAEAARQEAEADAEAQRALVAELQAQIAAAQAAAAAPVAIARVYNPNTGEHFFTASAEEAQNLAAIGWRLESLEAWSAPASSATPVYRLYNANGSEHHYTAGSNEVAFLVAAGWSFEGVAFFSDAAGSMPVYRVYNPNAFSNNHHYTTDAAEAEGLVALGWRDEGTAFYGLPS